MKSCFIRTETEQRAFWSLDYEQADQIFNAEKRSAGTIGSATVATSAIAATNRLSSEFSKAWHGRERSATDAPTPSFWDGVDEQHIEGLTLSMTAMLDDEDSN